MIHTDQLLRPHEISLKWNFGFYPTHYDDDNDDNNSNNDNNDDDNNNNNNNIKILCIIVVIMTCITIIIFSFSVSHIKYYLFHLVMHDAIGIPRHSILKIDNYQFSIYFSSWKLQLWSWSDSSITDQ